MEILLKASAEPDVFNELVAIKHKEPSQVIARMSQSMTVAQQNPPHLKQVFFEHILTPFASRGWSYPV